MRRLFTRTPIARISELITYVWISSKCQQKFNDTENKFQNIIEKLEC